SIFPSVGNGRPDDSDLKLIKSFGENCNKIIESLNNDAFSRLEINIKGNRPYRSTKPIPLKPKSKNTCNNCGLCYKICPTNSILKDSPKEINKDTCISCGACISNCPSNSKYFGGIMYKIAKVKFEKSNSVYKIPEVFYIC
ncbi:MAG: 4Fe-4S binding protein, partial [Peptostreptococcaceae bacterium]|nr:4Fe-4S binding protein [Peptostreptococcaceae bacterium]